MLAAFPEFRFLHLRDARRRLSRIDHPKPNASTARPPTLLERWRRVFPPPYGSGPRESLVSAERITAASPGLIALPLHEYEIEMPASMPIERFIGAVRAHYGLPRSPVLRRLQIAGEEWLVIDLSQAP